MFVNYSNHLSSKWEERQIEAARAYGRITDVPFPMVPPSATEEEVETLAKDEAAKIAAMRPAAVLCQGEFTLVFCLVSILLQQDITVLSACSERNTEERAGKDGKIETVYKFSFVKFREYRMVQWK